MSPSDINYSTNDASSNSTTPPSETTLAEELQSIPGADLQIGCIQYRAVSASNLNENQYMSENLRDQACDSLVGPSNDASAGLMADFEDPECSLLSYSRTNRVDKLVDLLNAYHRNEISLTLNYKGHQKQNYSWSALHLACYFGHEQIVELLLSDERSRSELDINIMNSSGDTPLHKAALTNRTRIVQLLLSSGANVFIKNCDGFLAKQLTTDKHIFQMLEASEQADRNLLKQNMFKAVDNGDLKKLQEYFLDYDLLQDAPEIGLVAEENLDAQLADRPSGSTSARRQSGLASGFPGSDFTDEMTDERGNTLLHLAAMRGFKAICVYLLEQGFDPYKKNNLGQTCIELSSYQLRKLFMSVKPAGRQLKRLSKERITRFEGPLLRKVRILGWKQIYVVLENGVILLFNNRRDSMNKSRRGYKYLESATCEADPSDLGMFTVRFSDNSRATFLVSPNHLSYYTTFKLSDSNQGAPGNQIELVRQKWLDSLRDHIIYSTEFIRKGFKFNDDDDFESMNYDGGSLSTMNHLLPLDTIKSFVIEARAHYSILERHAESLCSLAQSILVANQHPRTSSLETNSRQQRAGNGRWVPPSPIPASNEFDGQSLAITAPPLANTTASTGSRILEFMRPNRLLRATASANECEESSPCQSIGVSSLCKRPTSSNSNPPKEFMRDNWPILLFHLRLLIESTENTKTSMGQALALMEHQEQLRQNRVQDQEERCRVLENSLQTLARDHHELEKSLSMSQIYHSACRSVSMSTDLNEYHDAFEDFDDDKTMTPNSLPSDEELDQRIQDVINEEEQRGLLDGEAGSSCIFGKRLAANKDAVEDEEDLDSNCSALTIETVTDQFLSLADVSNLGDNSPSSYISR